MKTYSLDKESPLQHQDHGRTCHRIGVNLPIYLGAKMTRYWDLSFLTIFILRNVWLIVYLSTFLEEGVPDVHKICPYNKMYAFFLYGQIHSNSMTHPCLVHLVISIVSACISICLLDYYQKKQ